MSLRYICDGCGKSLDNDLPLGWHRMGACHHACSEACKAYIEAHGARPPATVTAIRPREGDEPWRREIADQFGGAAMLGAMAVGVIGSLLSDLPASGWARPARGEACHYFENRRSLCGEWNGYRGAVMTRPMLNKVCETCKEKRRETRP